MKDWSSKKVLVTGAGGFIGSHLVEGLVHRGASVECMVHYNSRNSWGLLGLIDESVKKGIDVVAGDIQDPFFVEKIVQGCEIVFHLCSLIPIPYSYIAPQSYIRTNVEGALNVFQACRKHSVEKIIHVSTSEVYGSAISIPMKEDHPLQAQSPYAASKIGADMIASSFYRSFDTPISILRPFNTYGPRQSARAIIPTIISQALRRPVVKLGASSPIRDLTFVDDTVKGLIAIAESEKTIGETIHIGSGRGVSIAELTNLIFKLLNYEGKIEFAEERFRPEKSEVQQLVCDYGKAKELLDWVPMISLEEGLLKTIEFIKRALELYSSDKYVI